MAVTGKALSTDFRHNDVYIALLEKIKQSVVSAQYVVERFVDRKKLETNWGVGQSIDAYLEFNKQTPSFSRASFYEQLAEDLGVTARFLQKTVRFYRMYPQIDFSLPFNWTHYVVLISISDGKERLSWENRIIEEGLSATQVKALWRQRQRERVRILRVDDKDLHELQRGMLYVYRIVQDEHLHGESRRLLDLGFSMRLDWPELFKPSYHSGKLIQSYKIEGRYYLKEARDIRNQLYTYKAFVRRVIDADTIVVNIDVGFGLWREETLRLRGIDAPEINTVDGQSARKYVVDELSACPFVVIKTYGSDKYDRYLVDVFTLPGEEDPSKVAEQGGLLNHTLLSLGMARKFMGS